MTTSTSAPARSSPAWSGASSPRWPVLDVALDPAPLVRRLATAGIAGLGAALPPDAVPNRTVATRLGVDESWIERRTGIRARRHAAAGATLAELAAEAGERALRDAQLDPAALDLVLVASLSQDAVLPNAAPLVAQSLGAARAGAFDVGAACTGFVSALAAGGALIEAGRAEHVLAIGAELLSRRLDHDDKRTAPLFGDGAGAAVLSAGAAGRIGQTVLGADGSGGHFIRTDADGLIRMDGHETFQHAVARLAESTVRACGAEGLGLDDVDLFVFHQANGRILSAVAERLGLPADRVVDCIGELGNTSAASIPLALAHARDDGRLSPGAHVVLAAFGAGLTWGAAIVEWGDA